jgi:nitrous oxidase accessory protein NosD
MAMIILNLAAPRLWAVCDPCPGCTATSVHYVRSCASSPDNPGQCNDNNDGKSPQSAWATLTQASRYLNGDLTGQTPNFGDVIIVGPGIYNEGDVSVKATQPGAGGIAGRPIQFRADPAGACTGDAPGAVLVDVEQSADTGFLVFGASYIVVDGFNVTNARIAGVQIRPSPTGDQSIGTVVSNNVLYGNGSMTKGGDAIGRGVDIIDSDQVTVFNNLIYHNLSTGVGVLGSPHVRVVNNTMYANGGSGIVVSHDEPSKVPSEGGWVIDNIIDEEGGVGIDVDELSRCDYIGAFNLIGGSADNRYSKTTPKDRSDIVGTDPGFSAPDSGDFTLQPGSAAIDAGSVDASTLGLDASSATSDRVPDTGPVDLGYHAGGNSYPDLQDAPLTTQVLYVRASGSDVNDGLTPEHAFATVNGALPWARAQTRIIVGPGRYVENIGLDWAKPAGPLELVGDSTGRTTNDLSGLALIDGNHKGDGINITGRCSSLIDGLAVTNGSDVKQTDGNGIYLKDSNGSIVRNSVTFSNGSVGINIEDSNDVQILNNLSYGNGDKADKRGGGVQVGGAIGTVGAVIENNTCYGNGVNGIQVGTGTGASTGASVFYNIMQENGQAGIQLGSDTTYQLDTPGYMTGLNINADGKYGAGTPHGTDLINVDPLFISPAGQDGILGGSGYADDDFHLSQIAAGQSMDSPAVDAGDITALQAGLSRLTTRTDNGPDNGKDDLGYHYPRQTGPLIGDCNGDGEVTIDELILAVNIALGNAKMSQCRALDGDGDGKASVNELIRAVSNSLQSSGPNG